jgi:hypothetical protein
VVANIEPKELNKAYRQINQESRAGEVIRNYNEMVAEIVKKNNAYTTVVSPP